MSDPEEPRKPPEHLIGRKPGDRRVRVARPRAAYFRYEGHGVLHARPKASEPKTPFGRGLARVRRWLLGRPLASDEEIGERLSKKKALAIFSSDAISSSAYATEEILRVLVLAGAAALVFSLWIAIAIAIMLAVVSTSYRQIGYAYPSGGGAYAVGKANLGRYAALVAAAALLLDYIMTVAVSTSSGVEQITSALPSLAPINVEIGVTAVGLITLGNLRGIRESGNIFAIPTYLFVGSALVMVALGVFRIVFLGAGGPPPDPLPVAPVHDTVATVGILLLLRAFAAGSVALTGTEAIANGVTAFKPKPSEAHNAAQTLTAMAILLAILFVGITFVAQHFGVVAVDDPTTGKVEQTVVAQVAAIVYGPDSLGFYLFQVFTALILFLAANTSFNAFPRLAAILAQDGYMPRHFAFRGDRLAFTLGILLLGGISAGVLVLFHGETTALIPLYSVGVFVSFTISQGGMVRHWHLSHDQGWHQRLAINAFGCALTAVVSVVVVVAKAPSSLLVAIIIPTLVAMMLFIHRQYSGQAKELEVRPEAVIGPPHREERVVIPVPGLTRAVVQAVNFGRSISENVVCVHVTDDLAAGEALRERFERQLPGVPVVIVESPFRSLVNPFVAYLDVTYTDPKIIVIVVLPEYVGKHWWDRVLYNQVTNRLRKALVGRPHTVIATIPYRGEW
ncbi:MAG: APC family permease [Candidatus Limnocylindrales bacterium]